MVWAFRVYGGFRVLGFRVGRPKPFQMPSGVAMWGSLSFAFLGVLKQIVAFGVE